MLECQDSGGSKDDHLLRVDDGFKGRTHGHFCLAVAHVTAKEAVHWLRTLHIAFHVGDGDGLVGRFVKLEGVLKFALKRAVWGKCEALSRFSLGIKFQEFIGHVFDRFAHASLASRPGGAAKFVEDWLRAFDGAVTLHEVEALERHVKSRVVRVMQAHELAACAAVFDLMQAFKLADPVVHMDDVIAGFQL